MKQQELESMTKEEFGPEYNRAMSEIEIKNAMDKFGPVIMYWIEKSFNAGFRSTFVDEKEAFKSFCKRNSI